jgi:crotonobetaine/carnitine-CoA ligase
MAMIIRAAIPQRASPLLFTARILNEATTDLMNQSPKSEFHPPWFRPGRPDREDSVLPYLLERNARESPDKIQLQFEDGETWTCRQTLENTRSTAALLRQQGVTAGDFVLAWMPSGQAMIRSWFALNYLGAVFVPINVDYRGSILRHAIAESNARIMITHPQLVERLDVLDDLPLDLLLSVGQAPKLQNHDLKVIETDLSGDGSLPAQPEPVNQWDLQMIIFTSGTTGPSKGVMCPYLHMWSTGQATYGYLNDEDCILVELPMFHVGGVSPVMAGLTNRAKIALYGGFSTDRYWQRVGESGATTTSGLIGSMASFLERAPPQTGEADNSLRMLTVMLNQQVINVAARYRFSYISGFNMTELSGPLITEVDCPVTGSLGRPRTGCECRVVDEHDYECAPNETGELIVRMEQPWTVNVGYLNRPEATAAAWRNGWFHTGDLVMRDEEGNFFFVDRKKDAVRRRGENVSSIEVESEIVGFETVAEAAVVGIASEHGDQEILAAVVLKPGHEFAPRELAEYLVPRMPHYMVPRYIRAMGELPRTPTNKVKKVEIREAGVTADTWDREAANMRLKRTHFN